jgi:hypothetical protein
MLSIRKNIFRRPTQQKLLCWSSCLAAMLFGSYPGYAKTATSAHNIGIMPSIAYSALGDIKKTGVVNRYATAKFSSKHIMPSKSVLKTKIKTATNVTPLIYHHGPIMLGTTNIHYVWYGDWSGDNAPAILGDFAKSIGGSAYYKINTTYYDSKKNRVSNAVRYKSNLQYRDDPAPYGNELSQDDIKQIVTDAIGSGIPDAHGVYFVLTSADIGQSDVGDLSSFCDGYCGWHDSTKIKGVNVKYSFVGNPDRCPSDCASDDNYFSSPNNNTGADGMVSIVAHELVEAVTDPDTVTGWYDKDREENGDKCSWSFGKTYYMTNDSIANVKLGSRYFLIQQNWVNKPGSAGYCSLTL